MNCRIASTIIALFIPAVTRRSSRIMGKSFVAVLAACLTWVIECSTGNDCIRFLEVLDEKSIRTNHNHTFKVKFEHPFLDSAKGYVPNIQYSITILNPRLVAAQELIIASLSVRRAKRESIGIFGYDSSRFTLLKCKPNGTQHGETEILSASASQNNGILVQFPLTVTWTAPRDTAPDCVLFKFAFASSKILGKWAVLKERLCKNRGTYHFITGHSGMDEFSLNGPTTRIFLMQAEHAGNVYAQIVRASYLGAAGTGLCAGANVRISENAIERNFSTFSHPLCFADALSQPTSVFRSEYGVIMMEVAIFSIGHFSFEISYYNLPADKGCNVTVDHRKSGAIQSPNYPSDYFGGMDCYYTIRVDEQERIVGRFVELQLHQASYSRGLQKSFACDHGDYVESTRHYQTLKWCGEKSAEKQSTDQTAFDFQSADNIMIFHFHSGARPTGRVRPRQRHYFKMVWRAVASCPQSQKFTGMRGRITTIGYPKSYLSSQRCVYNIEVPRGFVVQLRFRDFRLQPTDRFVADCQRPTFAHDYVKIGEKKFCGNWSGLEAERLVFMSTTRFINFTFVSDEWAAFSGGFSAEFRAVAPNETLECRPGQSFFGGLCYDVRDHPADWASALRNCQMGGGILAVVSSVSIQRFLNQLLASIDGSEEHAYWIGATDKQYETDFIWISGEKVDYSIPEHLNTYLDDDTEKLLALTDWFHGWPTFDYYNKQPNDDGLSQQNCLEMRKLFMQPSKGHAYAEQFFWNDRECDARNGYICQYPRIGSPHLTLSNGVKYTSCNETIMLTPSAWRASVSSPKYPERYPDFADCYIVIEPAPPGHVLILDFNKFILEDHASCEYDYLEIWEETIPKREMQEANHKTKICGDKSEELKLLRRAVTEKRLILRFVSDHSRAFMGLQLNVYMDDQKLSRTLNLCNDKNWRHHKDHCYLLAFYPMVDWKTARDICGANKNSLAVPESFEEENFLIQEILKSPDYKIGDALWLGARRGVLTETWSLESGRGAFNYTDWFQNEMSLDYTSILHRGQTRTKDTCLTLQQHFHIGSGSNPPITASRPYWGQQPCANVAGYVCKAPKPLPDRSERLGSRGGPTYMYTSMHNGVHVLVITEGQKINDTLYVNGSGTLALPGYPSPYPNFFDYSVRLLAEGNTRILITFQWLDIEYQRNCAYDYLHLRTFQDDTPMKLCGLTTDRKLNFASYSNQALIHFHSDNSITGEGFVAAYQVINISDCYVDTNQPSGFINSVNFPNFYLNALACVSTIRAPKGSRIFLDFVYFDVGSGSDQAACQDTDYVSIYLDGEYSSRYVRLCGQLNLANAGHGLTFLSQNNLMRVVFHSDATHWGVGYRAKYDAIRTNNMIQVINPNQTTHDVLSPNYPLSYPDDFCLQQIYRLSYGYQMIVEFQELEMPFYRLEGDMVFIRDSFQHGYNPGSQNVSLTTYWNRFTLDVCTSNKSSAGEQRDLTARYKAVLSVVEDPLFWRNKTLSNYTGLIETCDPNPCRNGGTCGLSPDGYYCRCKLSYLGAFCHISPCDLRPCVRGSCVVTSTPAKFRCDCHSGYEGVLCNEEIHRCASNPCQRGTCVEGLDSYTCICIDGYKGENCQKADLLNATTLRESFLRDPFWLGLFLVLGVIGIVGVTRCFRKRFKYGSFRVQDDDETLRRKELSETDSAEEQALLDACLNTAADFGPSVSGEDEDAVYFTLRDLGIGPSHYRNLGRFEKVNFKLKLSDLTEQELDVLEAYLEHIAATMEGTTDDDDQLRGDSIGSSILKPAPFATALETVTSIILKSAEIVDEQQMQEVQQRRAIKPVRTQSARRATFASIKQHVIRGAARRFPSFRRPRSIELAEIKTKLSVKSLPGTISFGRASSSAVRNASVDT